MRNAKAAKRSHLGGILSVALVSALWSAEVRAQAFERLNAAQIRAAVVGREISDSYHSDEYYRRDGTLIVTDPGSGVRQQGRWTVEGDQLCTAHAAGRPMQCFQVWRAGDAVSLRRREQDRPPLAVLRDHAGR